MDRRAGEDRPRRQPIASVTCLRDATSPCQSYPDAMPKGASSSARECLKMGMSMGKR